MILKKSLLPKLSRLLTGFIILLSFVACSGSVAANSDTRKPVDRETIAKRNRTNKRSISFQHARQQLIEADFYREIGLLSLTNSLLQLDRVLHINVQTREKEKPDRVKISQTMQLHLPRSADDLQNLASQG